MTVGVSPKVLNPVVASIAAGVVLLVVGLVASDTTIRDLAIGVLTAAVGHAGIGYVSSPGQVIQEVGPPSDDGLSADAQAALQTPPQA